MATMGGDVVVEEMTMALGAPEVTVAVEGGEGSRENEGDRLSSVGNVVEDMLSKVTVEGGEDVTSAPHKKLREDNATEMDVDEPTLTSENKENILHTIKRLTRKELEDLVLTKIVEAVVKHSEAGKFRNRMLEMQVQKDKMQQRVTHLQKQVVEMGKAVKLLLDNHNRDPNNVNQQKKRPPPIKFYRSVGLQVTIEPPLRNGPTRMVHVTNSNGFPINGVISNINNKGLNGTMHNVPATPTKRPGPKSQTDQKVLGSKTGNNVIAKGLNKMNGHLTSPTKVATLSTQSQTNKQISNPTVVDLTDDASLQDSGNPVQYRYSQNSGVQLVQQTPGAYQIVSNGNGSQGRSVVVQNTSNSSRPTHSVMVRTVTTPKPNTGSRPSVAAAVPQRAVAIVRAPQQLKNSKPQLPPLPLSSVANVPRGRVLKDLPPRPTLTLNEQTEGIVLSWSMNSQVQHAEIASYQIYACQEALAGSPGKTTAWKKVGDVKALPLPMACTLSQFTQGNRYFFVVRALDTHGRSGPFCEAGVIVLKNK